MHQARKQESVNSSSVLGTKLARSPLGSLFLSALGNMKIQIKSEKSCLKNAGICPHSCQKSKIHMHWKGRNRVGLCWFVIMVSHETLEFHRNLAKKGCFLEGLPLTLITSRINSEVNWMNMMWNSY